MYFTQKELQMIITWAVFRAVQSLGIPTDDLEPEDAVTILAANKGHLKVITELADAYTKWYEYHFYLFKNGKQGELTPEENNTLTALILRRDKAKKAFHDATDPKAV